MIYSNRKLVFRLTEKFNSLFKNPNKCLFQREFEKLEDKKNISKTILKWFNQLQNKKSDCNNLLFNRILKFVRSLADSNLNLKDIVYELIIQLYI